MYRSKMQIVILSKLGGNMNRATQYRRRSSGCLAF